MAVTYTRVPDGNDVFGGRNKVKFADFQAASGTTYPSGGFVLSASLFELKFIRGISIVGGDVSQGAYFGSFDFTTSFPGKGAATVALRLFTASGTELSGTVGSTGYNVRLLAYGQ
jgi:hypothetical protein